MFGAASTNISIFIAFVAGIFSFVSPCVLPLIPSYITYITGLSFEDFSEEESKAQVRKLTILHSIIFIIGFTMVFVALGASATAISNLMNSYKTLIRIIGGIIVIIFGIHITGLVNLKFLEKQKTIQLKNKPAGYIGTLLVGITFGAGWTPCIGPILGAILYMAMNMKTVYAGIILLTAYSLGLGIPFFLSSLAINSFLVYFKKFRKYIKAVTVASGVFLVLIGILLISDKFTTISSYLEGMIPQINMITPSHTKSR
ncbi:MAG: cytochrome c biogenesis protein CcdA [Deltaproteobacteria bacterium]|nr:cytochrome c biogenesis protein CcdA [Deltaproteobacteria bacterium]MCL5792652.1 cytochrome c biogenesis protein CcdA [Deltaproteobacteria bacterium]